jgi:hypothetical protein
VIHRSGIPRPVFDLQLDTGFDLVVEETGRVAYQHTISVPLVATPLKRSTVVFVATLTMRYVPGWVLNGRIAESVEVGALGGDVDAEEAVEVSEEVEAVEGAEDVVDIEVAEDVADDEELAVKEGDETEEDIEVSEAFESENNVNDEENVNAEEGVELADEEKTELVGCCCCSCCWGVGTCLPLYATKSPPPKPPPIAPPNTTSTSANAIQNVRVGSPHMRGVGGIDFGSSSIYAASIYAVSIDAASFVLRCWYMSLCHESSPR